MKVGRLAALTMTALLLTAHSVRATSDPTLTVDLNATQHPISPYIYGINFADESLAADLRLPLRRWGGNATTRYNWRLDTANRAHDWFFENVPEPNDDPAMLPDGSSVDRFVEQDQRTNTRTLLTLPLIGWTPKARATDCGFSVEKYGAQSQISPYYADCGNGLNLAGSPIQNNDPADTSIPITPSFVQDWMRHLIGRFGTADKGGVQFYSLDNEPTLWNITHRDVHPQPVNYDELRDRTLQYAAAIKEVDPKAQTLGPVAWGWTAYFYSALDEAPGGQWWKDPKDRNAHGGTPLAAWYLEQIHAYERQHGQRLLDYFDLHYYPGADKVALQPAGNSATQALRLRSTRSLWDATYQDESYIAEPVRLIPRMHDWVDRNYPGTKLSISEYNFGALDDLNGALAQADVLGIFGRERLDLAALWAPPASDAPGAFAFRMYRNYDGNGSAFGDMSVKAESTDQAQLAVYAARRADGALTVIIINKTDQLLTSRTTLRGLKTTSAQVYRYSVANLSDITHEADQALDPDGFTTTYPPTSITLLVLR